jgi:hypothetical protein
MATHFEDQSPLGNAAVMLEACREEYIRAGFREDAAALMGLELTSANALTLAWLTLRSLPKRTPEVEDVRNYTLVSLQSALRFSSLRHAG